MSSYEISPKEFSTININGNELNMWMIKPKNFDPNKEYYSEKLILLNNNNLSINKKNISEIYLKEKYQGSYKIIERYENCFFVERSND